MLRQQLAFAFLFTLTLAAHAITPIHPLPDSAVNGKITVTKVQDSGHITTDAPVDVNAPEPGSLGHFSSLVADAVSALEQKAEEAKKEFAPEIKMLQEKEHEAAQALHAAQAKVSLELQPELNKITHEQAKLRADAEKLKASLQPFVSRLQESVTKVAGDVSLKAFAISDEMRKQMPGKIEEAKQSIAAAELAIKEDLQAGLDKLKPVVDSAHVQPWDAVEAEVRSDVERMGRMFTEQLQHLQQTQPGVLPPLRGGPHVAFFSSTRPHSNDQQPHMPPFMQSPRMPMLPSFMQHGPAGFGRAVRIRLGVPIVSVVPSQSHPGKDVQRGGDDHRHEAEEQEEQEEHGKHGRHGHRRHGGRFHGFGRWLRKHLGMRQRKDMHPVEQQQQQQQQQQQHRGVVVVRLHTNQDNQQADVNDEEDFSQSDSFHEDHHHRHHGFRHGHRFAKCIFGIVFPIIFFVSVALILRRCMRCCNGRQRAADVRVVSGVVTRGQQQQQQQQHPNFHINHPFHHQYQQPQHQSFYPPPPPPPQHQHQAQFAAQAPPNPYCDNAWTAARSAAPPPPPRVVGATFPHFGSVFGGATAPPQGDGIEMRVLH